MSAHILAAATALGLVFGLILARRLVSPALLAVAWLGATLAGRADEAHALRRMLAACLGLGRERLLIDLV